MLTTVIAFLAFALSLSQWIYTLYGKRTRFNISIARAECYHHKDYDRYILALEIQNLSSAPLIVTRIYLFNEPCYLTHQWIGDHFYPKFPESDIPITERKLSDDFPINLSPNSGKIINVIIDFHNSEKSFYVENHLVPIRVSTAYKAKEYNLFCPSFQNRELYF